MAGFCRQCSIKLFGEDYGDFSCIANDEFPTATVLCEGCGMTLVDKEGTCVGYDCDEEHNVKED